MKQAARPVRVLVVAGLDPSGGAGLVADLEALRAAGARGWAVAAALTAQGAGGARGFAPGLPSPLGAGLGRVLAPGLPSPRGAGLGRVLAPGLPSPRGAGLGRVLAPGLPSPRGAGLGRVFEPVSEAMLLAQLDALLGGRERPRAVKTGMVGSAALARALANRLRAPPLRRVPLVVDPVLAASSGTPLFDAAGLSPGEALLPLLARAWLATPNLPELAALTGDDVSTDEAAVRAARRLPARAVLVKGGHRQGAPLDLLVEGGRVTRFAGRRREGTARGTGCRLASGIAAFLAAGAPLEEAVRRAKRLVERYLDRA